MTLKEKAYIIGILVEARSDLQCRILSLRCIDMSDQATSDMEHIYNDDINAIDKAIEIIANKK